MTVPSAGPLPPDVNLGPGILAVSWLECILAFIFVVLRMYCRTRLVHNVGRDDWTMVFSYVSSVRAILVSLEY